MSKFSNGCKEEKNKGINGTQLDDEQSGLFHKKENKHRDLIQKYLYKNFLWGYHPPEEFRIWKTQISTDTLKQWLDLVLHQQPSDSKSTTLTITPLSPPPRFINQCSKSNEGTLFNHERL